jgi:hypothetical protein
MKGQKYSAAFPPLYVYSVHLEDGKFIAVYATTDVPPKVGETITLDDKRLFEVLDEISYKPISGNKLVTLTVKPVNQ